MEEAHPFLSVITINLNNAAGLRGTIESVLSQDGIAPEDLEYIIIDGGSTDGSADMIKDFAARKDFPHKIAYWVSEKDSGIYNAMNKGIRESHGEYVAILNSGDSYVRDALRGLKDEAKTRQGAVLCGAIDCTIGGTFVRVGGRSFTELPWQMVAHPATFVPLKVYKEIGLYDESFPILADWDLFATFWEKKVPFSHLPKMITMFDLGGISSVMDRAYRKERTRLLLKHFGRAAVIRYRIKNIARLVLPAGIWLIMAKCKAAIKQNKGKQNKGASA